MFSERLTFVFHSQQNKSCPFCRTPLGSKRVLRNDFITEHISKIK